jgi:Amt family ammonium transporter
VYSFVATWVILKVLDAIMGLRVDEDSERRGLDISQHGEPAYVMSE